MYVSCWNYIPFQLSVTEGPHITVRMARQFMSLVISLLASMLQFQDIVTFTCLMSKLSCEKYSDENDKQFF